MREVGADGRLVERGDRDREMVDVAAFAARRRAARRAQLAVDGDEIDQRTAGAQLIEADSGLHALVGAAENLPIKAGHTVEIDDAKDHMVDRAKGERSEERSVGKGCGRTCRS